MAVINRVACLLLTPQFLKTGHAALDESGFLSLAESCLRFSPQVATREREAIFIDIGRCEKLYSEEGLRLRLLALASRFGSEARVAIASNAGEALVLARYHTRDPLQLPLSALSDYVDPFTYDIDAQKKIREWIRTLILLGLREVGDFASLPSSTLASRFGKEAIEIHARVRGELRPAWPGFRPRQKIIERVEVGDLQTQAPCAMLESLLFGMKGLVDHTVARLRGSCERASVVKLRLEFEKWSTLRSHHREWVIHLPLPQGGVHGLLAILQERLQFDLGQTPLPAPVQAISFEVLEAVPGIGAQRDFFHQKEEEAEAWNALVGRLTYRLGKDRVFTAQMTERYLPEGGWVKTLSPLAQKDFARLWARRPSRVVRDPEKLSMQGGALVHPSGQRWQILKWNGPERLSGEWWKDESLRGFYRDYFRVVTATGEKLWVYINRLEKEEEVAFYLHGYFD